MLKKNKFFSGLLIFLFVNTCFAFAGEPVTFDSVCKAISSRPVTYGNFKQIKSVLVRGKSTNLNSNGTFIICTKGVVWDTKKPVPSVMVVTEDKMVQTMPGGKTSVMEGSGNAVYSGISSTLSSMFRGNAEGLKKNFEVKFFQEEGLWKIFLTPKDANISAAIKSIELEGTSDEKFEMQKILLTENSNQKVQYIFTDQKYSEVLTDAQKRYFK